MFKNAFKTTAFASVLSSSLILPIFANEIENASKQDLPGLSLQLPQIARDLYNHIYALTESDGSASQMASILSQRLDNPAVTQTQRAAAALLIHALHHSDNMHAVQQLFHGVVKDGDPIGAIVNHHLNRLERELQHRPEEREKFIAALIPLVQQLSAIELAPNPGSLDSLQAALNHFFTNAKSGQSEDSPNNAPDVLAQPESGTAAKRQSLRSSRRHVVPAGEFTPEFINEILDEVIMRRDPLLTVGGVKPFSNVDLYYAVGSSNPQYEALKKIIPSKVTNPNLMFLYKRNLYEPAPGRKQWLVTITIINRESVARLLNDKTAIGMLKFRRILPPRNVDEWVALYEKAGDANGYSHKGARWANLVVGIALGYPPLEAEKYAYARNRQEGNARGLGTTEAGRSKFSGYMRWTDLEPERDAFFINSRSRIGNNYDRLLKNGHTPLEIINDPAELMEGLPPFPKQFLLEEGATTRNDTH